MNQIVFDTIFTVVNLGVLAFVFFLAYKIIHYIRSKTKKQHT